MRFEVSVTVTDVKAGTMSNVCGLTIDARNRVRFLDENGRRIRNWDNGLRHFGVPKSRLSTSAIKLTPSISS